MSIQSQSHPIRVVVLPGDGIGPEVIASAVSVLERAAAAHDLTLELTERPIAGAAIAVVIAFILRGRGGDKSALGAAQGDLFTEGYEPGKS